MNPRRIKELLEQNNTSSLVQRSIDALRHEASVLKSSGPLPIQHVRRTTKIRSQNSSQVPVLVEGYDQLLRALETETDGSVQIYFFDADGESFTIYTDSATSRLLGVLISRDAFIES